MTTTVDPGQVLAAIGFLRAAATAVEAHDTERRGRAAQPLKHWTGKHCVEFVGDLERQRGQAVRIARDLRAFADQARGAVAA